MPPRRTHYSWVAHNRKAKNTSIASTSTASSSEITRTHSVPSTPRHRSTLLSDLVIVEQTLDVEVAATPTAADVEGRRARSRNRVDHSTRRVLFVDHKVARRQTAPPASLITHESTSMERLAIHDSPQLRLEDLPSPVMEMQEPSPSPTHSTTDFGEFVSAPAPEPFVAPVTDQPGAESGTESISDKKERRPRGGFRLFGRKRSNSVTSHSARLSDAEPSSANRIRRKSPYPAKAVSSKPAVTMSDADATHTTRWLLSRPKRLTKKAGSDSLTRNQEPEDSTLEHSAVDDVNHSPSHIRFFSSPIHTPSTPSRTNTLLHSSNSTTTQTPTKSRFNPLRDLEAHLYNRHGLGTGPSTRDAYRATPVPKTGIPRTRPYQLPGVERPVPSKRNSLGTPTPVSRRESTKTADGTSTQKRDVESPQLTRIEDDLGRKSPLRRVSAPAGSTISSLSTSLPRPATPSRAHTQPL